MYANDPKRQHPSDVVYKSCFQIQHDVLILYCYSFVHCFSQHFAKNLSDLQAQTQRGDDLFNNRNSLQG